MRNSDVTAAEVSVLKGCTTFVSKSVICIPKACFKRKKTGHIAHYCTAVDSTTKKAGAGVVVKMTEVNTAEVRKPRMDSVPPLEPEKKFNGGQRAGEAKKSVADQRIGEKKEEYLKQEFKLLEERQAREKKEEAERQAREKKEEAEHQEKKEEAERQERKEEADCKE
ncbi:hypothetical protein PoB_002742600 [Plakobranchus ocellatus]|uniref:Uncharacterized protein n=1 Tax=Plakobranchus ocellatus TaxID=259542 RepID=A0AAV3ZYD8_9GAST|nr:hypothetical protein PoB_002742600 [Plakobranchus ocellatus]